MNSTEQVLLSTSAALTSWESMNRRRRSKRPPKKRSSRKGDPSVNNSALAYLKGFQDGLRLSLDARSASKQPSRSSSQQKTKHIISSERCNSLHKLLPESFLRSEKLPEQLPRSLLNTPAGTRPNKLFHNSTPYGTMNSQPSSPCQRTMCTSKARTEAILHKMRVKQIKALFTSLNPQNGLLQGDFVQLTELPSHVKTLLRPLLLEIVEVGITMDFQEFYNRVQSLLSSLSRAEQQTFFASSKRRASQNEANTQANSKRQKLKVRRPSKKSAR